MGLNLKGDKMDKIGTRKGQVEEGFLLQRDTKKHFCICHLLDFFFVVRGGLLGHHPFNGKLSQ